MSDLAPAFESYALASAVLGACFVLAPEQPDAHRVATPSGQVIGVPCADSSAPLTAAALDAFLAAAALDAFLAAPLALPAVLPAWRIHAVAKLHDLSATITTILAALPEPQKTIATAAWTQGNEIARDSATYLAIVAALALDAEAEAGLWAEAAALVV